MNSFGRIFRVSIFGESHNPVMGIVLDGVPAGMPLCSDDFEPDLRRRQAGARGTTPRKENDLPQLVSGVFNGHSTGAPLTILVANENIRTADYDKLRDIPRPGHADFVARHKFKGFEDYRGGGHFSGRLTVLLVAAGVIAKKILSPLRVDARIASIGGETDPEIGLQKAIDRKDSVGGIVECVVRGVPIGWGEPFFDSVESVLAHALFAIPAVKGVEFGAGFAAAQMFGSQHNDPIINLQGTTLSNHAGGIVGGISNGNDLVFRVAIKPTSSTPQDQQTINLSTQTIDTLRIRGRHDLCIALRAPVVVEAVAAIALADLMALHRALWQ